MRKTRTLALKADTEKFVRTALAHSSEQKTPEPKIRKAVDEIVKAFQPVVLRQQREK